MAMLHADIRPAFQMAAAFCFLNPTRTLPRAAVRCHTSHAPPPAFRSGLKLRAFSSGEGEAAAAAVEMKVSDKPSICTADELHHVSVSKSDWRLALWRYLPPPQAPRRNHPLLLLSGVGTNAIGYDLSPECSFARYMSNQGFDTWILEFRGAGLSTQGMEPNEIEQFTNSMSEQAEAAAKTSGNEAILAGEQSAASNALNGFEIANLPVQEDLTPIETVWDESTMVTKLTDTFMRLSESFSGFLTESQLKIMAAKLFDQISKLLEDSQLADRFNEVRLNLSNLLESGPKSAISGQIRDLSERLVNIIEEGQRSVPSQFVDLQERFSTTIEDFQKQLELIVKYDWDFDHYLEEDVPAAIEYIRCQSKPKDGKLLAIGHSMGGILLYAIMSRSGFEGRDPGLAAVVTLASSVDYTSSKSSLKFLLPLADPAQALNVPAVPLGTLLAAAYPLSSRPPYVLSWLSPLISAEGMMHPELLEKLILNNFCTIPAKLVLQLTTAFKEGGLTDRSGTFFYKDHLQKSTVPILAVSGDQDLICPPEAVYETVKVIPEHLVTYEVFGGSGCQHYAHYDLVGGRLASEEVYPRVVRFLCCYDLT